MFIADLNMIILIFSQIEFKQTRALYTYTTIDYYLSI